MPLDLPDGSACFVDANILYYHVVEMPPLSDPCSAFLERIVAGHVHAFTSAHVLAEAIHKIMLAEAASKFGLGRAGLVNWLQHHRERITELSEFRRAARELATLNIPLLPADTILLTEATDISAQSGLLTNDATIVALMRRQHVIHLVTNDDDFDEMTGLSVWKPR